MQSFSHRGLLYSISLCIITNNGFFMGWSRKEKVIVYYINVWGWVLRFHPNSISSKINTKIIYYIAQRAIWPQFCARKNVCERFRASFELFGVSFKCLSRVFWMSFACFLNSFECHLNVLWASFECHLSIFWASSECLPSLF